MGISDWWIFKSKDPYFEEIDSIISDFENAASCWFFSDWKDANTFFNNGMSPISYFSNIFKFNYDLPSFLNGGELEKRIESHFKERMGDFKGDYRSVTIKSMTGPDGTVKKIEKVRNKDGSERVKIISRKGTKDYVIEKFKNKNGKQEVKESIINNDNASRFAIKPKQPTPFKKNNYGSEVWTIPDNMFSKQIDEQLLGC